MATDNTKPKVKNPTTAVSTADVNPNLQAAFIAAVKAHGTSGTSGDDGAAGTSGVDADAAVQGIWQQLFGKNAMGADYAKAVSLYTNQSQDTGEAGRVQAVQNYAQSTQEYQGLQEDRYLDAIYATIQANVRKAQV